MPKLRRNVQYSPPVVSGGGGVTDHTALTSIGVNSHLTIDSHIADSTLHFTMPALDDLTDVTTGSPGAPEDGYALVWDDGTSGYVLASVGGGSALTYTVDDGPGTAANLLFGADLILRTAASAIEVIGTVSDNAKIQGYEADETTLTSQIQFNNSTYGMTFNNQVTSAITSILGKDSGAVLSVMAQFDPNGGQSLYNDNSLAFQTYVNGAEVHATTTDNPTITFYQDNNSTRNAFIQAHGTNGLIIESEVHGAGITLQGEDAGGAFRTMAFFDPDDAVELYYDNDVTVGTETRGLQIINTSSQPSVYFRTSIGGADRASFQSWSDDVFYMSNTVNSGHVSIRGKDSGGTTHTLILGDPDGSVGLYYDGDLALETYGSGIQVTRPGGGTPVINVLADTTTGDSAINFAQLTNGAVGQILYDDNAGSGRLKFRTALTGEGFLFTNIIDGDLLTIGSSGITVTGTTINLSSKPGTYTPTNVTTDRSYDANATTTAELADVLGSLIADLQTIGLIG